MSLKPGQSFLIPSGPGDKKHLHFIVVGPCVMRDYGHEPHVLLAGVTTFREGARCDSTCILEAGEHPFIKHRSYVSYWSMRIAPVTHVEAMRDKGVWIENEPCSPELLKKITAGVFTSGFVKNFVLDALAM